ncbi:MAG: response regulator [Halobacteriota archaeon]
MIETTRVKPVEILLIEDNPVDIRMTQEAFKDYRVANNLHSVTDGEAGMDFIYQRGEYKDAPRPDLILLDLNLPKKDGRAILDEVKADPKLRAIPIVILTTSELDEDMMGSYCHNANAFITKPIDFDDFVKMMRTIGDFWLTFVKLPHNAALV